MTDLAKLVELHRGLLADDRYIDRLVAEQPATQLDPNTGKLHEDAANRLGPNMTARFQRYLGHPESYGEQFPWSKAVWLVGSWCRRNHPHHRGPNDNWRGSLCRQAIRLVIDIGWSPEHAARVLKAPELEMVLETALLQVERYIDAARDKVEQREKQDAGVYEVYESAAPPEHRALDGLHRQECHHPACRARRAA